MIEMVVTAKTFGVRPSSFISDLSGYEAYCFDVAAAVYLRRLENGDKPRESGVDALSLI